MQVDVWLEHYLNIPHISFCLDELTKQLPFTPSWFDSIKYLSATKLNKLNKINSFAFSYLTYRNLLENSG